MKTMNCKNTWKIKHSKLSFCERTSRARRRSGTECGSNLRNTANRILRRKGKRFLNFKEIYKP